MHGLISPFCLLMISPKMDLMWRPSPSSCFSLLINSCIRVIQIYSLFLNFGMLCLFFCRKVVPFYVRSAKMILQFLLLSLSCCMDLFNSFNEIVILNSVLLSFILLQFTFIILKFPLFIILYGCDEFLTFCDWWLALVVCWVIFKWFVLCAISLERSEGWFHFIRVA